MSFTVIIPARYESKRLPGKPLRMLAGRPMVQHVYDQAVASGAELVAIATDDMRIEVAAQSFGARAVLTSSEHRSGTDRIAEAALVLGLEPDVIVVNLQGDEPLMPPASIAQVAQDLADNREADIATLCAPIRSVDELFDPHVVKVVRDRRGYGLYFSRAPIPWARDAFLNNQEELPLLDAFFRHVGLYAYRVGFLQTYVNWEVSPLEEAEALEQLRALDNHRRIHVAEAVELPGPGVDTEEDFQRVEALLTA
jgi:3-deoxy-manno-octulosonate cytidylyltransferase (CMP-KDO synthetase)